MGQAGFAMLAVALLLCVLSLSVQAQIESTTTGPSTTPPADPNEFPKERCYIVPGCTRCKKAPSLFPATGRRLQQAGSEVTKKFAAFSQVPNIYNQLNLPFCLECNTTGYVLGTRGRCCKYTVVLTHNQQDGCS